MISALIPAHNEMNTIGDVVRGCLNHCDEVIVVDDGSEDLTLQVARSAGAAVISNRSNLGIVKSTQIGLRAASGDIIVTLDADGQHDPSDIPSIVRPIILGEADLVMGVRNEAMSLSEILLGELTSLRVKSSDVGTGYRAFRKEMAQKIRLRGFCLCGSLVLEAHKQGARIVEVPVEIRPRRFGRSHWSFSRAILHLRQTLFVLIELLLPTNVVN